MEVGLGGETAKAQTQRGSGNELRDRITALQILEPKIDPEDVPAVEVRVQELIQLHRDPADCRIVAEAELLGMTAVATCDRDLLRRLGPVSGLPVLTPTDLWGRLRIEPGSPPWRRPAPGSPLSRATWWRW